MGVGTADSLEDLAGVVELEGGHGGDAVLGGDFAELVDVDLEELDFGVHLTQLLEDGRDGLAGAAPGGEVVDDNGAVGALNLLVEVVGAVGGQLWGQIEPGG